MKVNVELELSPEEMRRLLGLPDVGPVNDMLVDRLKDQVEKGLDGTLLRNMVQGMIKGGTQGFEAYQSLLGTLFRGAREQRTDESTPGATQPSATPSSPAQPDAPALD
ncbi:MAG: DUF6489 family protein, partial [Pseudomonadales bacterium]|nr:DUF6489 family protein [Pseudomonadales bacterium]